MPYIVQKRRTERIRCAPFRHKHLLLLPWQVIVILFGDGIRRHLHGHAIWTRRLIVLLLLLLSRRQQIIGDGLDQALDTVPASREAIGVELLSALAIVDVERIVLVIVVILHS